MQQHLESILFIPTRQHVGVFADRSDDIIGADGTASSEVVPVGTKPGGVAAQQSSRRGHWTEPAQWPWTAFVAFPDEESPT